jgi:hypothetical protein
MLHAVWRCALVLLLLVGCTAHDGAPTARPLPTAQIADAPLRTAAIEPRGWPAFRAPVMPYEQGAPLPTPLPTVPPVPLPAVGPGGLPFPLRTGRLELGVHAHLFWTNRSVPLQLARDGGFGWIRQQIHWADQEGPPGVYQWGDELDAIVAATSAAGLRLMLSVVRSPTFYGRFGRDGLPDDPAPFGRFVAALVQRYRGQIHAVQIWNEQNLAHENGGYVSTDDAGRYVELVKVAYAAIKAADPAVFVVTGAPASTAVNSPGLAISDVRYYAAMLGYQNGVLRTVTDAIGVHPGGSANPPETLWPAAPSTAQGWTEHPTFYFRNIEHIRELLEEYHYDDTPVWITEFGWATANDTPGFEFGDQVSFEQQADYLVGAVALVEQRYPWVGAMFVWNLNFSVLRAASGQPRHEQASFSILNADYTPRPAYAALRRAIAALRERGR